MFTDRARCAVQKTNLKKENLVRSGFYDSVLLIGAVTIFQTVSYNSDSTLFIAYLTCFSQNKIFDRHYNCNDFKNILNYNISIMLTINILNDCNISVAMTFNVLELHCEYTVITTSATNSFSIIDL
jgi:hypothetical protein